MKYWSEVTKKLYDTEMDLAAAEAVAKKADAEKEAKSKARAARAKEVEDAYRAVMEANKHYNELKDKFVEDYGSFHMTITSKTPLQSKPDIFDMLFNL